MPAPTTLPAQVRTRYQHWTAEVCSGEYSTATWKLVSGSGEIHFAKVTWAGQYPSLSDERDRMLWARPYLPVPDVIAYGVEDDVEWLVTSALPGTDATRVKDDPASVVCALGEGLCAFHQAPTDGCPFDFTLDASLDHVRRRVVGEGVPVSQGDFHEEFAHLTPTTALAELERTCPASEDVVVCHGDYCFPNMLIEDGRVTGYVDLGELGLADRWWDIAVGAWSVTWNVDPKWEPLFYEAYGVEPDPDRIRFYRLLYDLAS